MTGKFVRGVVKVCVPVCSCLFGWRSDQLCINKKKTHEGKQGLRKQRGRCRSRLLPGIVRITDGGGWLRKSENIKKSGPPMGGSH